MTTTPELQTSQRFGLPDRAIQAIQQVLAAHPEVEQARVYGSRALGRERSASDIDLTLTQIEAELDDLLLRDHVARVGQVLYERSHRPD